MLEGRGEVLSREFPGQHPEELVVHRGQFHEVVVGEDRVVCFARTPAAAARLPERAAVLRTLAGLSLGFATPVPLSETDGELPYLVLSRVPGAPLEAAVLDDQAVFSAVAAEYAALLTGLAAAGQQGLPRSSPQQWTEFAAAVRAELFSLMSPDGRVRAEGELAALRVLPHQHSAVVHGDLGGENVLWEWEHGLPRLAGVVDWDEVVLGHQAEDLAAIQASYGQPLVRAVVAHLGAEPELCWQIEAIGGTFALQQALAAVRDGDQEELDDGLAGYRSPDVQLAPQPRCTGRQDGGCPD